jgi:hypothetical protein
MGGAASKFDETEWDNVDGGLTEDSLTLDGAKPTGHHAILTLKKHSLVSQRDYDISDDQDILLYTTRGVHGTVKWFDLLGKGGEKLLRVQTDALREKWDIFAYTKPTFVGQQPDAEATKTAGEPLFRKVRVAITWDKHHGNVIRYGPDSRNGDDQDTSGVLLEESILRVEEVRSKSLSFQSYVPKLIEVPHPPLVGHWVWENTMTTHRMKMHLAKGTDVALHCVVAIMTNMVTLERNVGGVI